MHRDVTFALSLSPERVSRLEELQALFALACNSITPVVREARCWNRVALHHLVYRRIRADFPLLGSQMACNVIYSVCHAARAVYQHAESPWRLTGAEDKPLPLLKFRDDAPVYFDRHTLSLRAGRLSMFTLDGRMKFDANLSDEVHDLFAHQKLKEIILSKSLEGFSLHFSFGAVERGGHETIPDHVIIEDPSIEVLDERRSVDLSSWQQKRSTM